MVLVAPHDKKSSWKRATRSATHESDDVDETLIRSNTQSSQTTPNKEEFTPEQQETFLSDLFYPHFIEFIDTEQRSTKEDEMLKKRKSRILDDDEFREAYGFVRRNSMTQARTRILTRQAKVRDSLILVSTKGYIKVQIKRKSGREIKRLSYRLISDGQTQEALTPVKKHIQPFYTIAGRIRPRVCLCTCNNAKNNNFIVEIVFYGLIFSRNCVFSKGTSLFENNSSSGLPSFVFYRYKRYSYKYLSSFSSCVL